MWSLLISLSLVAATATSTTTNAEKAEQIVKTGVQLVLSKVLDVPVTVDKVTWNAEDGTLDLAGLNVANPTGFDAASAFTADKVQLKADLKTLFSPNPTVQLVEVDGAAVNAETNLTRGSNLYLLMKSARGFSSGGPLSKFKGEKKWRIEKGVLGATKVKIDNTLLQSYHAEKTIGPLEMAFPGPNGQGLPAQEAIAQFLGKLISELGITNEGEGQAVVQKLLPKVL